ncbi:MAG: hypothetical protein KJZ84_16570 [Bryobacteraceae bacterium]|nr:hypothetical protein [Bryobacteraceae bacterium]
MAWVEFTDDRNQRWLVNQMGLYMQIREYLHESMLLQRARVVREKKWIGPDLVTVDINFNGLRAAKDAEAPQLYDDLARRMLHDADQCFHQLADMREATKNSADSLARMQREASGETMRNIDRSVGRGEIALQAATVVRDVSATTLVVGATFLSGGTALAVLGAGSALKGTGTYQDTGNVGAALIDGTFTFAVGVIGVGAAANPAAANAASMTTRFGQAASGGMRQAVVQNAREKGVIVLVGASINATGEGIKGHLSGKSAEQSLKAAAARFGTDVAGGLFAGPMLDHMALPILVRVASDTGINTGADKLVDAASMQRQLATAPPQRVELFDAATSGPAGGEFIRARVLRRL